MCFSAARFNVSIWKVSVALHCTEPPLPQEGPSAGASQRAPPRASEVNRGAEMLTGCVRRLHQQLSPAVLGVPAAWGWALLLALSPDCTTRGSAESRESREHPSTAATPLPPSFFPVTASSLLASPPAAQQTWKRTPLKHTPDTHRSHSPSLLRVLDSPNHAEFLPSFFFFALFPTVPAAKPSLKPLSRHNPPPPPPPPPRPGGSRYRPACPFPRGCCQSPLPSCSCTPSPPAGTPWPGTPKLRGTRGSSSSTARGPPELLPSLKRRLGKAAPQRAPGAQPPG